MPRSFQIIAYHGASYVDTEIGVVDAISVMNIKEIKQLATPRGAVHAVICSIDWYQTSS